MKSLNDKIKNYRIQKRISQIDMVNAAGMSRGSYIAFENGKESVNLSLKSAIKIAKTLKLSFNELFGIENTTFKSKQNQKIIDKLNADLKEKNKQIEQKDLLIELLKKEIKLIKIKQS